MDTSHAISRSKSVVTRAGGRSSDRQAPLMAAGVAFYTFLSVFPAIIAVILLYGLVADPQTVQDQSQRLFRILPSEAASLISGQMEALIQTESSSLGVGLVVSVLFALYSASGGVSNLMAAINVMFGFKDERNFVKKKLVAIGLTFGAIVFLILVVALIVVVPSLIRAFVDVPGLAIALQVARWVTLAAAVAIAVSTLFRVAPDRPLTHSGSIVTRGSMVAAGLWIVTSVAFSLYVTFFGSYGKTYGALAGVVVLLLWLWAGYFALLLGACIEALDEGQTPTDRGTHAATSASS